MNYRNILQFIKKTWVILVFAAAIVYLATNFETFSQQLNTISLFSLITSVSLIGIGKLFLVELSRESVSQVSWKTHYSRMFYINSISQLAKYLPGGIWHFVGRAGFYHADGLELKKATQAIIIENMWLLSSATLVGVILYIADFNQIQTIIGSIVMILLWLVLLSLFSRIYVKSIDFMQSAKLIALQIIIWITIGMSFSILAIDKVNPVEMIALSGSFCVSWAVGYIIIIAPSGIGIREAVLSALIIAFLPLDEALIYVSLHRIMWVISELLLGLIARFIWKQGEIPSISPQR